MKSLDKLISTIPPWLRNPYVIVLTFFVMWMIFFDENHLAVQWKRKNDLRMLNEKIDYYQRNIAQTKEELYELKTSDFTKEKFAREHYYMKRENEEVFVFTHSQPETLQIKQWWENIF